MATTSPRATPLTDHAPAFRLGPTEHALLTGLGRYVYLTAAQCVRRAYQPGSLRFVQKRLARLAEAGYCQRHAGFSQAGKPPTVYCLTAKGWDYVRAEGMETPARWRGAEAARRGFAAYAHDLAVADVGIAAERFCATVALQAQLAQFRHHHFLQADPLRVQLPGQGARRVIFDAWLDLRLWRGDPPQQRQRALALELDRASEHQRAWREKIAAILAAAGAGYAEHFRTTSLTVLVVCPGHPRRLHQLMEWTELQLRQEGLETSRSLFALTAADPSATDPRDFFLGPCWRTPFRAEFGPLFTLTP
jgi:hypothetical protein